MQTNFFQRYTPPDRPVPSTGHPNHNHHMVDDSVNSGSDQNMSFMSSAKSSPVHHRNSDYGEMTATNDYNSQEQDDNNHGQMWESDDDRGEQTSR
jgi:hypothetical protein